MSMIVNDEELTLVRPETRPWRIDCHQCKLASDAKGIEVEFVLVDEAPALSSLIIR